MRRALKVVGVLVGCLVLLAVAGLAYLLVAYPKVGAASDVRVDATPARVARGQYLAQHVSVCTDCHSQRDNSRYAAPVKPETLGAGGDVWDEKIGFPGYLVARNLTPAALAGWSDGEILRAFTEGVARDGTPLFPIMPYPAYGQHMAREDALAIVAYLRTLPPRTVAATERRLDFPLSLVVRTMPAASHMPASPPPSTDRKAYGEYLTRIAACGECHTPRDQPERYMAGGEEFPMPNGTVARSANLTPHATGLAGWTEDVFLARFAAYADGAGHAPVAPTAPNTPMPWGSYAGMTREDLAAIFSYLQTVPAIDNRVEKFGQRAANE
jgi:mono/diheme cytochrome c family protein